MRTVLAERAINRKAADEQGRVGEDTSYPITASGSFSAAPDGTLIRVRLSSSWFPLAGLPVGGAIMGFLMAAETWTHGMTVSSRLLAAFGLGLFELAFFFATIYLHHLWAASAQADFLCRLLCDTLEAKDLHDAQHTLH